MTPPLILVPPDQLPPRALRTLRRAGVPLLPVSAESWQADATHVLQPSPAPSLALAVAIASPSVRILRTATPGAPPSEDTFASSGTLPADACLLWAGRVWLGAYAFWRDHHAPFAELRVALVGEHRPPSGGALFASRAIVRALLEAGGAVVTDDDPHFAVVAPRLTPATSPRVRRLVDDRILCLSAAFVIDLVLRAAAAPADYVLFDEQRALCGPLLGVGGSVGAPLPVTTRVPAGESPEQVNSECDAQDASKGDKQGCAARNENTADARTDGDIDRGPRRSKRLRKRATSNGNTTASSPSKPVCTPRRRPRTRKTSTTADPLASWLPNTISTATTTQPELKATSSAEKLPARSTVKSKPPPSAGNEPEPPSRGPVASSREPMRPIHDEPLAGNLTSPTTPAHPPNTAKRRRSPPRSPAACSSEEAPLVARRRKRPRGASPTLHQPAATRDSTFVVDLTSPDVKVTDCSTPATKEAAFPEGQEHCHDALDNVARELDLDEELPQVQWSAGGKGEAENIGTKPVSVHDNEWSSQRRRQPRGQVESTICNRSTLLTRGTPSGLLADALSDAPSSFAISKRPHEGADNIVEQGYNFLIGRLGGEPTEKAVQRLLDAIKTGGNLESDEEDEFDPTAVNGQQQAHRRDNPLNGEQSPLFDEEEEPMWDLDGSTRRCYEVENSNRNKISVQVGDDAGLHQTQKTRRRKKKQDAAGIPVDVFRIPFPKRTIVLSNVVRPELVLLERADDLLIATGHSDDDQICQESVSFSEWVLGAENLIGYSGNRTDKSAQANIVASSPKTWRSFEESDALQHLATAGGVPDAELLTLTGICVRLLSSDVTHDPKSWIVNGLLALRDRQENAGFDSLHNVLSVNDLDSVPVRDKAVAAIWIALIRRSVQDGDVKETWDFLNHVLLERIAQALSRENVQITKQVQAMEKSLTSILEIVVIVAHMFSARLDFACTEQVMAPKEDSRSRCPENWSIVCHCLNKLSETASSFEDPRSGGEILASFVRLLTVHVGGRVWPVNDELLASTAKAIASMSSLLGHSCFCTTAPSFVSQFRSLADETPVRTGLASALKTPCDAWFFLGWLYTMQGQGNVMKRAMNVVRNGAVFTKGGTGSLGTSCRTTNHHVGMLLAVGDSLAASSQDGEYLLCRMLTSKCPRPQSVALSNTGDHDEAWRATLQAISVRCGTLLAKGESTHVYSDWLSQSLVDIFCLLRKSAERRSQDVAGRETLRVQDSVFSSLAIHVLTTLVDLCESLLAAAQNHDNTRKKLVEKFVEKAARHIPIYGKVAEDIISQLRTNSAETVSKNRHVLLCSLLDLVEVQAKLILLMTKEHSTSELISADPRTFAFASDRVTESAMMNVFGGEQLIPDKGSTLQAKCRAGTIMAIIVELRSLKHEPQSDSDPEKLIAMLRRSNLDVTLRFETSAPVGVSGDAFVLGAEDRSRLAFWSQALQLRWPARMVRPKSRLAVMCVSTLLSCLASMTDEWKASEYVAIRRMAGDMARLKPLQQVIAPWISHVDRIGEHDLPTPPVSAVEAALRLLVKHWPTSQVKGVLALLQSRLRPLCTTKSAVKPDYLILYAFTHMIAAQLRGFNHARTLLTPLSDMTEAVTRMSCSPRDHLRTFEFVQTRVLSALCMSPSDMETRVLALRFANAFAPDDVLRGLWGKPLLPEGEVPEAWLRCAERYAQDWQGFLFGGVVEDPLFAGRNLLSAVRRLTAALDGVEHVRRLVWGVVARGKDRLDDVLRRDGRAWREWVNLCAGGGDG